MTRRAERQRWPYVLATVAHGLPLATSLERCLSLGAVARSLMAKPTTLATALAGQRVRLDDVKDVADALDRLLGERGWAPLDGGPRHTLLLIRVSEL